MQRFLPVFALLFTVTATPSVAQLPQIRLESIFPQGGQQGKRVGVVITGTDLDEASGLVFSDSRLKATAYVDSKKQIVANKFWVTIPADIESGLYDVRVGGLFGLSNPRIFRIGTLTEMPEKEPNGSIATAQEVPINTVVNARSATAADVDTFVVNAAEGQTIVFRSEASIVDSLMQPVLELFDAQGRRIGRARRKRQQDAVLVFTSPINQTLTLKVHDTAYAGGNEYGYRISIDTLPQVDFIRPAVLPLNVESEVVLFGRHLPYGEAMEHTGEGATLYQQKAKIKLDGRMRRYVGTDSSAASVDRIVYSGIEGNLISLAVDSRKAAHVQEPLTDTADGSPLKINLPANVSGSFASEMEEDVYRFVAEKGQQWQIEVLADRLGSIADPLLIVEQITKDKEGNESTKRLARQEINKQNPGGNNLPTLTTDPSFTLTTPADGIYQVRLKDRFVASRGDASLTYTLSVHPSMPDYRVVLFDSLPSADGKSPPGTGAISLRKGGTYQVPIYAYRYGGHNEPIRILSKGMPSGVTLSDATIPAGKSSTQLVLTASKDAEEGVGLINLIAASEKRGSASSVKIATLVHIGANGLPRTGRVTESLMVSVMKDLEPIHIQPAITSANVSQDQQLLVPLKLIRQAGFDNKVDVVFTGQPKNVDVPKVTIAKGADSAVARFYVNENATVGSSKLMMYATAQVSYVRNPWQLEKAKAAVAAAKAQIQSETKTETESKAIVENSQKKVLELGQLLKSVGVDIAKVTAEKKDVKAQVKQALVNRTPALKSLVELQSNVAVKNAASPVENLDVAIKAIADSTEATATAAKPVLALLQQIERLDQQIAGKQKLIATKYDEIAAAKKTIAEQQEINTAAGRSRTRATKLLKRLAATVKDLEAAEKKAEAAAKPQNKNVRVVAVPIQFTVHLTPGKLTAAIPNDGAIMKGTSVDVKVSLVRKNKFTGPVRVSLVVPEPDKRITSTTIEIPADKADAVIRLNAAADAGSGDITNAVIRATADFNGRTAHFDAPVAIKIKD